MSRNAYKRSRLLIAVSLVVGVSAVIAAAAAHSSREGRAKSGDEETVSLGLRLPSGSTVRSLGYVVRSARGETLSSGSVKVTDPEAPLSVDVSLPPGAGDTVTFIADPGAAGGQGWAYLGARTFDVVAGESHRVDVGTLATGSTTASASAFGGGASGAASTGTLGGAGAGPDCQTCELASDQGRCDPELLTALWNTPHGHDQVSWGCETLSPAPEKAACAALLHCLNTAHCAQGDSPIMGCYCGSVSAVPCFAGEGIDGPCVSLYKAAAAVSNEGPAIGSTDAQFSRFVATVAFNPTTPIGLADNINECSIQARCDPCERL